MVFIEIHSIWYGKVFRPVLPIHFNLSSKQDDEGVELGGVKFP